MATESAERAGVELPTEAAGGREQLRATAARCWQGACSWRAARAYAVGLYADTSASGASLDPEAPEASGGGVGRRLVLRMARSVRGDTIARHLRRDLRAASAPSDSAARLASSLDLGSHTRLPERSTVELFVAPGGETVASTDGRIRCMIDDGGELGRALLVAFLGEHSHYARHSLTQFQPIDSIHAPNAKPRLSGGATSAHE